MAENLSDLSTSYNYQHHFFLKKFNNYDNEIYKIKGVFVEKVWSKSRYLAKQK